MNNDKWIKASPCADDFVRACAEAWIDRWSALGGSFGYSFRRGEEPSLLRSMLVDLDLWTPTDCDNPDLPPHAWLLERKDHAGALKVLEALLVLLPGLQDAVSAIARTTAPPPLAAEAR